MNIREIIRMARSITDGEAPGLVVPRAQVVASYGSRIDANAEEYLEDLAPKFPSGFQMVQVTPPLLNLARERSGLSDKQLDDEVVAFYLALEYLIPWRLRDQFLKLRDCAATYYQIAKVFMVPRPFIEHLCDGGYAELSDRINRNI